MASRDITCHQLVLEDHPLGLAPTQDSPLTCLSCYTRLEEESSVECECGFRMCLSPECRQDETHKPEHDLFVRAGVRSQGRADYPLVMPIRLLTLLEGAGLETRDRLGRLMDHREDRRRPGGEWVQANRAVVQPILRLSQDQDWDEEDVQRCIGITRINGVRSGARISSGESPVSDEEQGEVRMLYPSMSIFSHSCSPNTQALNTLQYGLALRATKDLKAGEELTITYSNLLGSSVSRREDITNNWYFSCTCSRCSSQDFGSELDSWRCGQPGCDGLLRPESLSHRPDYVCRDCHHRLESSVILQREATIQHRLEVSLGHNTGYLTLSHNLSEDRL